MIETANLDIAKASFGGVCTFSLPVMSHALVRSGPSEVAVERAGGLDIEISGDVIE